ncbi:MAG: hypothetical protein B9S36_02710 [Verrucomicrobiia bacterium Tous-C2TDCM]|nr:MAG: hypothetical protein B9S36_02710 [Verrucomicrobiae bacterium Tous-C2TDCM]
MRVVPHLPLLWVALLVVTPATSWLVYAEGTEKVPAALLLLLVVLVALVDALLSRGLLEGLSLELSQLIRCTKGREVSVPLTLANRGGDLDWLRYGIEIPGDFRVDGEIVRRIESLCAGKRRTVEYPLLPLRRGRYFLERAHFETRSRFGLWLMRRSMPLETEVRVYPDLRAERRRLSSVFLLRGNEGSHLVRQVGKGRDFEQLREYQPGDDYTDVDWKATARRGKPVTRTYQIERTQEVYVVVDHSRLSAREIRVPAVTAPADDWLHREDSAGGDWLVTTQLEKFLHCSLILASVAERQGDLFGFISFADKEDRFIRAKNGKGHYNLVRDALYTLEPKPVAPDFEQLMIALRQRLTRRALLVMLVDLSDPLTAEHFYEALPLINRQHLVLVNMVRPEAARPLFSPLRIPETTGEVYENLAGHFQWQELCEAAKKLRRFGVELGIPDHEALCAEAVSQYLNVKKRQLI